MSTRYSSYFDDYAISHYIKKFNKKYSKKQWDITEMAILDMAENFDVMMQTDQVETIHEKDGNKICKFYFKIAGTNVSYKSSCCRAIAFVDPDKAEVIFLLVYHKSFLTGKGNETDKWERIIKDNFPKYSNMM
ncbi:MAG: hypothetical protein H6779_02190 [Candidatus Nomurabacteria bacterium]|nr:hypothetical protein [Candidatus Nomurabacteria bacterium]USN88234.1 MAG: hypothetical protein H6779_02190 [Candidatus Nomurabacteria bacterium]